MKVRMFVFAAVMAVLCLTANSVFAAQAPRLRIITTTFPLYDWTRQILGNQLKDVVFLWHYKLFGLFLLNLMVPLHQSIHIQSAYFTSQIKDKITIQFCLIHR